MCGGDLILTEGATVAECEYCGTRQTVPTADSEKKLTLFARANRLRLACEFDKAAGVYESIVADFPEEAEAYWGLVLCRYGIEYVDDPATGKKIPTCHRSSFDCVLEDGDFDQACENADVIARKVYREEAKTIETIRRGILEVSGKEAPYDIFICYKETDEDGQRTIDSVIAQDVYDALSEKGYRVFFSRITLEDKLGTEYEPYIFAALNSAKIMLVFGTDYEYFNAVWVKNEWSRFLSLIAAGQKKTLIPCYKGVDAYDMPKEFAKLQAQDMGKVGAMQDLTRGIDKILLKQTVKGSTVTQQAAASKIESLLERGYISLEDEKWDKAQELFDQALNIEPKCAEAYLGLAMVESQCVTRDGFVNAYVKRIISTDEKNIQRAKQFAGVKLRNWFNELDQEKEKECQRVIRLLSNKRKKISLASRMIAAAKFHTVGVKSSGNIIATEFIEGPMRYQQEMDCGQCNVNGSRGTIAVAAGYGHTVGLGINGCVGSTYYIGKGYCGQCDVRNWTNIIAIAAGYIYTVALKSDGTVVATGDNEYGQCEVSGWTDIMALSAGYAHTVGLKSHGNVVAVGDNRWGQCEVSNWENIVAAAAGWEHTVGLKADGTVVAVGNNEKCQCEVGGWKDIVAVAAGASHTVGLKLDGSVVAVGYNDDGRCEIDDWTDIVAIAAGAWNTVGLKSNGVVVAVGYNGEGQCNVNGWKLFNDLDTLEQERWEALNIEYKDLQEKQAKLRGPFTGKRRKEIEAQMVELEEELKILSERRNNER